MNDFTKEELQIILLDMNAYIHRTTILAESSSHKALRDKIEGLIDSHCEHKIENTAGWVYECQKCGRKIGDETQ